MEKSNTLENQTHPHNFIFMILFELEMSLIFSLNQKCFEVPEEVFL